MCEYLLLPLGRACWVWRSFGGSCAPAHIQQITAQVAECHTLCELTMIEFSNPPLALSISQYMELVELWNACSQCTGFCISLGKLFFSKGVEQIDGRILPKFIACAQKSTSPRVIPSYAIVCTTGIAGTASKQWQQQLEFESKIQPW